MIVLITALFFVVSPVVADIQMDWTEATATADFSGRNSHKVLTHLDRMYVIGGYDGSAKNDVWYSFDGETWVSTPSITPRFSPRQIHGAVSFNNQIWVIGGNGAGGQYLNDVWSSSDGEIWTQHVSDGDIFSPRYGHAVLVDNGKIWVIGGYDGHFKNDVWSSADGVHWVQETASAEFAPRHMHSALVYDGKMWVMAGEISENPYIYSNDVWSSSDGVTWERATVIPDNQFQTRSGQSAVVYDNTMWVISGVGDAYGNVRYNDAWYSIDGASWTKAVSDETFPTRYYADAVVYKSKIWVIGGYGGKRFGDVWNGPKGVTPTPTPTVTPALNVSQIYPLPDDPEFKQPYKIYVDVYSPTHDTTSRTISVHEMKADHILLPPVDINWNPTTYPQLFPDPISMNKNFNSANSEQSYYFEYMHKGDNVAPIRKLYSDMQNSGKQTALEIWDGVTKAWMTYRWGPVQQAALDSIKLLGMSAKPLQILSQGLSAFFGGPAVVMDADYLLASWDCVPRVTYTYVFQADEVFFNGQFLDSFQKDITVEMPLWNRLNFVSLVFWTDCTMSFMAESVFLPPPYDIVAGIASEGSSYMSDCTLDQVLVPDPDYTQPVQVVPFHMTETDLLPEGPAKEYLKQMEILCTDFSGLKDASLKFNLAEDANDTVWMTSLKKEQYLYQSKVLNDQDILIAKSIPVLEELDWQMTNLTSDDIDSQKQNISQNGLPAWQVTFYKKYGYTDKDLDAYKNAILSMPYDRIINSSKLILIDEFANQKLYERQLEEIAEDLGDDAPPYANFTTSVTSGKAPLTIQFTDTSLRSPGQWAWDFGDGATATTQNAKHTYTTGGTYTVTLTVTNSTTGSDTRTKYELISVITPTPLIANFTATNTTGKVPLTVRFTDTSLNTPTEWSWDFGDNTTTTEQNPLHTYSDVGTFTVSLTATNDDGSDTLTMTDLITVNPLTPPIPNFTASPRIGQVPLTVVFTDTSTGGVPTLWYWMFGDGTDAAGPNVTHTYTTPGNYTIVLEVANYDADVFETRPDYITVLPIPAPVADFSGSPTSGGAPLTVQFTDISTEEPTSWSWDFGDGYVSSVQNPVHQYDVSGTYTVNLTATNDGGSSTKTQTNYITVVNPANPITLIDQLIVYVNNQNNVPKVFKRLLIAELKDARQALHQNRPGDAVLGMNVFKMTVNLLKGWPLTYGQAATMQNSADAIIDAIDLLVNQAAIDQTNSLSADVKNLHLQRPVERPLVLKLDGAVFMLESAKDKTAVIYLNSFIASVRAQDGKKIPHDDAVQLIAKAEAIKTII